MESYRTVKQETSAEFIEKRSKFIGYIKPVQTEEEAIAFIQSIKSKHWDATHNVYAYSLREGQTRRYSDDGEPHGTAGKMCIRDSLYSMRVFVFCWVDIPCRNAAMQQIKFDIKEI